MLFLVIGISLTAQAQYLVDIYSSSSECIADVSI